MNRRTFIRTSALGGAAVSLIPSALRPRDRAGAGPAVVCTWNFGPGATNAAYTTLTTGGSVVDAVEHGVKVVEADPTVTSVGIGGFPDRDGHVTLDACIADGRGGCGAVVFLEHIGHPVSVARMVMERTPHVLLAGEGALQFALENGFSKEELLGEQARKAYEEWLKSSKYVPKGADRNNHDTIGMLAMDGRGRMAGACSTSGLSWKLHGRVGDSPIIGAGLFVDDEVGGATATGLGEAVIKVAGTAAIVELMRRGSSPQEACTEVLARIVRKQPQYKEVNDFLVGFLAMSREGEIGAVSYRKGLQYSLNTDGTNRVVDAEYMVR